MPGSARRALKVLEVVAGSERPLGVTDIARQIGLPAGTVFRTLDALQQSACVERYQASSRYVVGPASARLRQSLLAQFKLRDVALPHLRRLASLSGETASLIVPLGWYAVRAAAARGSNEITHAAPLGYLSPWGQHFAATTILAFASEEAIARYFAWESVHAPSTRSVTLEDLFLIRERGFSIERSDFVKGHGALALPVRNGDEAIAAIAIEGPVLDLKRPRPDVTLLDSVHAVEAVVKAHPEAFENPFGHLDPDSILLDRE